ncbi:hypothetical protein [Paenarthrobacter nitroguajacolicus]|uniref:hypothetical protein n=1 Tax=Paenarthrobacter nitroguajacolicus TaxID=211146 RepID=UPI00248CC338|nr:hypothetical protein [Paenarthrobacter nitroguajacolicus]MDI2037294.1 hypothetical protein [Paenarthrobacter nitroguajacolicus]
MNTHKHSEWEVLVGAFVEVRHQGLVVRRGIVEEAMPNGSAIWITAEGTLPRKIYEKTEGFLIYVEPQMLEGTFAYRMTTSNLFSSSPIPVVPVSASN